MLDTCIVEGVIEMSVSRDGLFDHRSHILFPRNVGFNEDRFATSLLDYVNRLLTFPLASARNDDLRTFTGKRCRCNPPEPEVPPVISATFPSNGLMIIYTFYSVIAYLENNLLKWVQAILGRHENNFRAQIS